jgi:hypothetical protein
MKLYPVLFVFYNTLWLSLLTLWGAEASSSPSAFTSHFPQQQQQHGSSSRTDNSHIRVLRPTYHHPSSRKTTSTELFGGRKKGTLGRNVSVNDIPKKKTKTIQKKNENSVKISSSLSQWAKSLGDQSSSSSSKEQMSPKEEEEVRDQSTLVSASKSGDERNVVDSLLDNDETDAVTNYEPFDGASSTSSSTSSSSSNKKSLGKNSRRRERTKIRQASNDMKILQIQKSINDITQLISSKNLPVENLVSKIKSLTQLPSPITLKALLNQKARDYSLAWVGSDEAICHIGTGLHKVPLARLQDIFLTIGRDGSGEGKTLRLMEVIRILGPFPNVRNTLEGKITKMNTQENENAAVNKRVLRKDVIQICYDSMMDGLGKQITAGTVDNLRYVDLEVLFADERALVCVVPSQAQSSTGDGSIGEKGENVLFFLKEDDLDYKLEELRAA